MKEMQYSRYIDGSSALDLNSLESRMCESALSFTYLPGSSASDLGQSFDSPAAWMKSRSAIAADALGVREMLSLVDHAVSCHCANGYCGNGRQMPAWAAWGSVAALAIVGVLVALI